jgi:tetracycline repressor-like protein
MTTVTKGFQSRRARKKAAMRAQIIAAAIRLFSGHGIEAVTVDQIAAAADVGKGHMFLHTEQFLPYMAEMQKVIDPPLEALFGALQRR